MLLEGHYKGMAESADLVSQHTKHTKNMSTRLSFLPSLPALVRFSGSDAIRHTVGFTLGAPLYRNRPEITAETSLISYDSIATSGI